MIPTICHVGVLYPGLQEVVQLELRGTTGNLQKQLNLGLRDAVLQVEPDFPKP